MNSNDFYSHFPSLNSNSKENIRHKRISNEYQKYLESLKKESQRPSKHQQRAQEQRENAASTSFSSDTTSTPTMDEIFSAEERNRVEDVQKEEKRRVYQQMLEQQIEEQKTKRMLEQERRKQHELQLERTLQRQLENIRRERDPLYDKVVERVSLSENEKEVFNNSRVSLHNSTSNNDVYRYFSHSAKTDSELFNYKRYFSDVLEPEISAKHDFDLMPRDYTNKPIHIAPRDEPHRSEKLGLKTVEFVAPPKSPEIDTCQCQTQAKCSRCHKKLEMFCKDCNERHDKSLPEATNRRQIEYNEPELPFTANQQVVVYRPSEQNAPFSFNVDANSVFYKDALEELQNFNEQKLVNYIKLYGDLRNRKLNLDHDTKSRKLKLDRETQQAQLPKVTGTIPKERPVKDSNKTIVLSPSKSSDLEDLLSNAQYTVITQVGFARKQLELDKLKL